MKAEHHKDQKTNTVVATLEKVGASLKQGPSKRTGVVLGIAALLVLLFIVWKIVTGVSTSRNSKRWEDVQAATAPDDLKEFIDKNKNTAQGRAARLQVARQQKNDGLKGIYTSREAAVKDLETAATEFEKLAIDYKAEPMLVQQCLYEAAEAHEAMGDSDKASSLYGEVAKRFPDSTLGKRADKQVSILKDRADELRKIQEQLKK